jgi:hypothetical protein
VYPTLELRLTPVREPAPASLGPRRPMNPHPRSIELQIGDPQVGELGRAGRRLRERPRGREASARQRVQRRGAAQGHFLIAERTRNGQRSRREAHVEGGVAGRQPEFAADPEEQPDSGATKVLSRETRRRAVDARCAHEGPRMLRRDLVETRDAVTHLNEPAGPIEQLNDPPEALYRHRTAGRKLAFNATDLVHQELFPVLPMLAHVRTSHAGSGHGPGGVCAPAGATR